MWRTRIQQADSQRYSGAIGLVRRARARKQASVSLNGTVERIEYDDSTTVLDVDYDRVSGYASYSVEGARTGLEVRAGYTTVDGALRTDDAPLFGLTLTRQVGRPLHARVQRGHQPDRLGGRIHTRPELGGVDAGTGGVIVSQRPVAV